MQLQNWFFFYVIYLIAYKKCDIFFYELHKIVWGVEHFMY